MRSAGTRTFSKTSSDGFVREIVSIFRTWRTPGVSMSTKNTEMPPRAFFSGSVTATSWMKSAMSPQPINHLWPLIT